MHKQELTSGSYAGHQYIGSNVQPMKSFDTIYSCIERTFHPAFDFGRTNSFTSRLPRHIAGRRRHAKLGTKTAAPSAILRPNLSARGQGRRHRRRIGTVALAVHPHALNSARKSLFIAVAAAGFLAFVSCAVAQDAEATGSPNPAEVSVFDMPAIAVGRTLGRGAGRHRQPPRRRGRSHRSRQSVPIGRRPALRTHGGAHSGASHGRRPRRARAGR